MSKPPLPLYEQATIRAWSMDYAIRINRGASATPHQMIEDAIEIEAWLTGKPAAEVRELMTVVKDKNGQR